MNILQTVILGHYCLISYLAPFMARFHRMFQNRVKSTVAIEAGPKPMAYNPAAAAIGTVWFWQLYSP